METSIDGAHGVLINITGSMDMGLDDVEAAATLVQAAAHPDANIIFGAGFDNSLEDEIVVTVIATGFEEKKPAGRPEVGVQEENRDANLFSGAREKAENASPARRPLPIRRIPSIPFSVSSTANKRGALKKASAIPGGMPFSRAAVLCPRAEEGPCRRAHASGRAAISPAETSNAVRVTGFPVDVFYVFPALDAAQHPDAGSHCPAGG